MGKLDGKVAIVTGAARGLARAYAKRLAGLGAKVAVADLNDPAAACRAIQRDRKALARVPRNTPACCPHCPDRPDRCVG
jgi:NAD(P)-dependent dehydrogenase (short-subunit alcohol dehydrogenase family)